jgi:hypothetical protein
MSKIFHTSATALLAALTVAGLAPNEAGAQSSGRGRVAVVPTDTLSVEIKTQIRNFYAARPPSGTKALPPGIRRNLQRGKTLPPGIAKKSVPNQLQTRLKIADGYELLEVGLDVFLVEVATKVIHDVLRDIIR